MKRNLTYEERVHAQVEFEKQVGERHTCEECFAWVSDLVKTPHCDECGEHYDKSRISCEELAEVRKAEDREWDKSP